MSWPAEIDVFLAVGELAPYVAYLDGWPVRQRIWPWATALVGLAVSVAGNIGHIQADPGHPVIVADRLTAATSPLAAFAGLAIGLLVLKMTRRYAVVTQATFVQPAPVLVLAKNTDEVPEHPATSNGREYHQTRWGEGIVTDDRFEPLNRYDRYARLIEGRAARLRQPRLRRPGRR